ncbi:hypothetical protein HanXRQr2_Chr11g0492531 [Helianthus annuus]|uniref:Uncharacterized protein n=1 Tax=Helianthus annuus TaxID=4232 RepID=A0A251TCA9_HELAN|nr:hypothetical protein HanXRQr2_Chr11g0492531 [Helianthus annuus]
MAKSAFRWSLSMVTLHQHQEHQFRMILSWFERICWITCLVNLRYAFTRSITP